MPGHYEWSEEGYPRRRIWVEDEEKKPLSNEEVRIVRCFSDHEGENCICDLVGAVVELDGRDPRYKHAFYKIKDHKQLVLEEEFRLI